MPGCVKSQHVKADAVAGRDGLRADADDGSAGAGTAVTLRLHRISTTETA
jgi:hypothetical protein